MKLNFLLIILLIVIILVLIFLKNKIKKSNDKLLHGKEHKYNLKLKNFFNKIDLPIAYKEKSLKIQNNKFNYYRKLVDFDIKDLNKDNIHEIYKNFYNLFQKLKFKKEILDFFKSNFKIKQKIKYKIKDEIIHDMYFLNLGIGYDAYKNYKKIYLNYVKNDYQFEIIKSIDFNLTENKYKLYECYHNVDKKQILDYLNFIVKQKKIVNLIKKANLHSNNIILKHKTDNKFYNCELTGIYIMFKLKINKLKDLLYELISFYTNNLIQFDLWYKSNQNKIVYWISFNNNKEITIYTRES